MARKIRTVITVCQGGEELSFSMDELKVWLDIQRRGGSVPENLSPLFRRLVDSIRRAWDIWSADPSKAGLPAERLHEALAESVLTDLADVLVQPEEA